MKYIWKGRKTQIKKKYISKEGFSDLNVLGQIISLKTSHFEKGFLNQGRKLSSSVFFQKGRYKRSS